MKIHLVTNLNNSFSGFVDYPEGTTVDDVLSEVANGADSDGFRVRVNRETVSPDFPLKNGDRVTVTPSRIEGA
jgi:sulfur carrier protein ThiS